MSFDIIQFYFLFTFLQMYLELNTSNNIFQKKNLDLIKIGNAIEIATQ